MEFHLSKLKIFGFVILAIGFVVAGLFLIEIDGIKAKIAGWLSIAFFGFGALVLIWQLLKSNKKPAVLISDEGIVDNRTNVGLIPWADVSRIWVGEIHSQKFLCIETHSNTQSVPALAAAGNSALGFPKITMAFSGLNPGLKAAIAHIQAIQPTKFTTNAV
jgi:hypothetical protein